MKTPLARHLGDRMPWPQVSNTAPAHSPSEAAELRDLRPRAWLGGWAIIAPTRNVENILRVPYEPLPLKALGSR